MKIIGITGNSGSGKSSVSEIIAKKCDNSIIIDADKIAKSMASINTKYYNAIKKEFGKDILKANLEIDRKKLANIIFNNDNIDYKFDINSLLFVRKSDEFTSLLDFNNKESIYYLNELEENSKIFSKIIIKQLIKEDTSYIINYRVNEEDFCFKLSYKEVNL